MEYAKSLKLSSLYQKLSQEQAKLNLMGSKDSQRLMKYRTGLRSKRISYRMRQRDKKDSFVAAIDHGFTMIMLTIEKVLNVALTALVCMIVTAH